MIGYLQGTVQGKWQRQIILLVQGVGYLVHVSNDVLGQLQEKQKLSLFIFTQVKQDDICLYGFREENELKFFKQLIGVSGIGAKTAMTILDMPINMTQKAISDADIGYLSKIPGLGKKTAERLALELKGKVDSSPLASSEHAGIARSVQEEALDALVSLGYDKHRIIRFFNETPDQPETAEDLVKSFLQKA